MRVRVSSTAPLAATLVVTFSYVVSSLRRTFSFSAVSPWRRDRIQRYHHHRILMATAPDESSRAPSFSWAPLDPSNFDKSVALPASSRRYAKDENYLNAVLSIWKKEFSSQDTPVETSTLTYTDAGGNSLYGHIVRSAIKEETVSTTTPGVLLFHTAAGPQDVFLFYKASLLARKGCVVMICDILSDPNGWAWDSDRSPYNEKREQLAKDDHRLLRSRVEASILVLVQESSLNVDRHHLAAMGWCLGGQPILEVPRIQMDASGLDVTMRAMVTFHGVFRRETPLPKLTASTDQTHNCHVLICNGKDDPFVSPQDLGETKSYFEEVNCKVEILSLDGARHGFTNPAQAYNDNDSFDYNEDAAEKAWKRATRLLQEQLFA